MIVTEFNSHVSYFRQSVLNNIVKEMLNAVTRIVGWGLTTLVIVLESELVRFDETEVCEDIISIFQVLYGNVFDSGR